MQTQPSKEIILETRNLEKTYPNGTKGLRGVSLTVHQGDFLVIIGLSGSGKSTYLRCLNRLIEPTGGEILYKNQNVTTVTGDELRAYRRNIGMIFQQFNLVKRKTVLDNVISGALGELTTFQAITGRFPSHVVDEAMKYIQIVGLEKFVRSRADALSGGQQQRVAIARSLMQHPSVLLADEPVANLDPATSNSVMQYLEKVNQELGMTIICNLHFLSLVRKYASRVIALKQGELIFSGMPNDVDDSWFKRIYGEDAVEVEIE